MNRQLATISPAHAGANRTQLYFIVNAVFLVATLGTALATDVVNPRVVYVVLMFAVCTSPLLLADRLNGPYTLLAALLSMYFLLYGASDLAALVTHAAPSEAVGILSPAEIAILMGGALVIVGYRLAVATPAESNRPKPIGDWSLASIVALGVGLWILGTWATWFWQVDHYRTSTEANNDLNAFSTLALIIARLVQPLGTLLLGYALAVSRNRALLALVILTVLTQIVVGFIGDTKETAIRGGALVILALTMVNGRLPKFWLAAAAAFVICAFPVFQAYRLEVMDVRGLTRAQAAADIAHSFELALQSREKITQGASEEYRAPSFLERINAKPTIELLIAKTGHEVAFQRGYTLALFFTGFVPRLFWPDKPDSSVGQLFNREFRVSADPGTYISPSDLGELYWNFGWAGIACGMPLLGFMLGRVNRSCDLSQGRSVTRLLVLATTIYATCVRFEGSIALEYIVWVRTLAAIGLMHLVLARAPASFGESHPASVPSKELLPLEPAVFKYPNVLR